MESDCSELFHKARDNEFQLQERKYCLDIRKHVAMIRILPQQNRLLEKWEILKVLSHYIFWFSAMYLCPKIQESYFYTSQCPEYNEFYYFLLVSLNILVSVILFALSNKEGYPTVSFTYQTVASCKILDGPTSVYFGPSSAIESFHMFCISDEFEKCPNEVREWRQTRLEKMHRISLWHSSNSCSISMDDFSPIG